MSKRFLVVDDEEDVLVLVAANLRALGHDVMTAETAAEGRATCVEQRPDVLILDVSMPDMDGPAFLQGLRDEGVEPGAVYLLSAIPPEQLDELAADLGVRAIQKPFTAPSLREALADELA